VSTGQALGFNLFQGWVMRFVWMIALLLAACASEKLALAPPVGVDLSGHWRLNEADSDDPQRVAQSQNLGLGAGPGAGGQGGQGGPSGRGGRRGGAGGGYAQGPTGPAMPGVNAINDGLRWPGKELEARQTGGTLVLTSLGAKQVYQPVADTLSMGHRRPADGAAGRDSRRGDGPPLACGWDDRTLVVQPQGADDDYPAYEERYSLSSDGARLIEVIAFKGGRSGGFTVSRVWDRVAPEAAQAPDGNVRRQ
jgi:hypothetical protein